MNSYFIVKFLFSVAMDIFILRIWMQWAQVDFFNPLTQAIAKITNPVIAPLNRLLPTVKNINLPSLLILWIIAILKVVVMIYFFNQFWFFDLAFLYYGFLTAIYNFGDLIFWILMARAILSWVKPDAPIAWTLAQLTEPLIKPIRRIIPPIGVIDISFMIFMLVLFGINQLLLKVLGQAWIIAMN